MAYKDKEKRKAYDAQRWLTYKFRKPKRSKELNLLYSLRKPKRPRALNLLYNYKRHDRDANRICDLTEKWLEDNICSKPCTYCGSTVSVGADRIDNSKGHTMDNVLPCCRRCNITRMNRFSVDEMKLLGPALKQIWAIRDVTP